MSKTFSMFWPKVRHPVFAGLLTLLNLVFIADAIAQAPCPNLLHGLKSTIWPTLEIPVCWEELTPEHEQGRRWSRQAVEDTWQKHSALRFVGWGQCTASSNGIRIKVGDERPFSYFGTQGNGRRGGMTLNFAHKIWGPFCSDRLEYCIKAYAVHEFGHALGFTHEQDRDDAPLWCQEKRDRRPVGDIHVTRYDSESVMNYCNPNWNNHGKLSALDIEGLQRWYGKPAQPFNRFDGRWTATLTYSDSACVADHVDVVVSGNAVTGTMTTPDNRRVSVQASLDSEGRLQGFEMRLSPKDLITLKGVLTDGVTTSTDCGCGSYRFSRK